MPSCRVHFLYIALCVYLGFFNSTDSFAQNDQKLPEGLYQLSTDPHFSNVAVVVDKATRTLKIFGTQPDSSLKILAEYPTDIGKSSGNKEKSGDHKTPEGIYFLENKLTNPSISFDLYGSMAFTTDYPNVFDKRVAKTGNGIWLHAIPDTVPLTRGSRGCVVVRDDVIKQIAPYIKLKKTPILIFDQVNYLPTSEHQKQRAQLLSFIDNWRKDWESQDIDRYIRHYDETFKTQGFNFKQWFAHKRNLKDKYEYIKVQIDAPSILQNKDQLILKALQRYESNKHVDYGEKTIYAKITPSGIKIVREEWTPLDNSSTLLTTDTKQPHSEHQN